MLVAFQPGRARKFMVFLLSEYHARKLLRVPRAEETGADATSAQRRQQHLFFRVRIKARKEMFGMTAPADCHVWRSA